MTYWLRLLFGYDVRLHRRLRVRTHDTDMTGVLSTTQTSADPPWMRWLVQGLAQVPPPTRTCSFHGISIYQPAAYGVVNGKKRWPTTLEACIVNDVREQKCGI